MAQQTILIIEDDDRNLKLARDVLEHKGYRVDAARSAEEGLKRAEDCTPSLVLMDIRLPGMGGLEAIAHLRRLPGMAAVPVVAFSASVMPEDLQKVNTAGFDAQLQKPIELQVFLATISRLLAAPEA